MADEVSVLTARAIQAEAEIAQLEAEIAMLQDPQKLIANGIISPELDKLQTENAKLKFQITHLNRNIAAEEKRNPDHMISISQIVTDVFSLAIRQAFPEVEDPPVLIKKGRFADYQCDSALTLCQKLKVLGIKKNPEEIAKAIVEQIPPVDFFEKLEVTKGFINVYLSKKYVAEQVAKILKKGVCPPKVPVKRRVVIDFSSPNIAKEMHVGHLRSTIIGESISRLLEWVGHDVLRLNHLGDWGTQFGMLIAHLQDKFPNYLTVSPPISDLQAFYKESKVRFDEDEEFKKRAYNAVVKLQAYEKDHMKAWNLICDVSRKEFEKVYQRLGVTIVDRGESFYQEMMKDVVRELDDKGLTEMDEGRKVMFVEGQKVPLTLVKSDGGFTYDTSDMAAIRHRLLVEKGNWLIYVVDQGQGSHFDIIYPAAEKVGWLNRNVSRVEHVAFGVVLGEDKEGESCNHVVAFLYQIHHWSSTRTKEIPAERSCTSRPQKWHKPRGDKITPQPLMKLTFAKATTDRQQRKRDPVLCRLYDARAKKSRSMTSDEALDSMGKALKSRSRNIPFSYILDDRDYSMKESLFGDIPDGSPLSYQLQDYHTMVYSFEAYLPLPVQEQNDYNIASFPSLPTKFGEPTIQVTEDVFSKDIMDLVQSLSLDMKKCSELESLTVTQSENPLWYSSRARRLTSSKFGNIINRKSVPSSAFVRNTFQSKDLCNIRPIAHGLEKESLARKVYVKKMKKMNHDVTVYYSGLIVNLAFPYLGASPDGKVMDRNASDKFGLLEIKCPFKYRNEIPSAVLGNADFCLERIAGRPRLKRKHDYYCQVQGQMAIFGLSWCDFVVYTNKGIFVERIVFDKDLWIREMFPKLTEFYFSYAVKHLLLKDDSAVSSDPKPSTSAE